MQLRLLKVICQPVFVLDDGENLIERPVQPVIVSSREWPTYAEGAFADEYARLKMEVEAANGQAPEIFDNESVGVGG